MSDANAHSVTADMPAGQRVRIPGRGTTFVRDVPGPPGAPTVVLLHGLGATASINWPGAFRLLSEQFRVVALDHRGHGRGIRTARPFRLRDCADDVVSLADELGIEHFVAVGYSMGGPIALLARRRHPSRVTGLVLCATSAWFSDDAANSSPLGAAVATSLRLTPPAVRRQLTQSMVRYLERQTAVSPAFLDEARRHDPAAILEATRALRRFDARPWATRLGCPAASVVTERDSLVPMDRQLELAHATRATVHPVRGNHDVAVRAPARFLPALLDACRSVSRPAALVDDGGAIPLQASGPQ
jgi:pimeloyl-ACP methyl ester carboxylesterase